MKDGQLLVALERVAPGERAEACAARLGRELGGANFHVSARYLSPFAARVWGIFREELGEEAARGVWGGLVGSNVYIPVRGFDLVLTRGDGGILPLLEEVRCLPD